MFGVLHFRAVKKSQAGDTLGAVVTVHQGVSLSFLSVRQPTVLGVEGTVGG
jgi:hypothetical protein